MLITKQTGKHWTTKHLSSSKVQSLQRSQELYFSVYLLSVALDHRAFCKFSSQLFMRSQRQPLQCSMPWAGSLVSNSFLCYSLTASQSHFKTIYFLCLLCPQTVLSYNGQQMTSKGTAVTWESKSRIPQNYPHAGTIYRIFYEEVWQKHYSQQH